MCSKYYFIHNRQVWILLNIFFVSQILTVFGWASGISIINIIIINNNNLSGNEMFYATLYLLHFSAGFWFYLLALLAIISFPVAVAKSGIALLQVEKNFVLQGSIDVNNKTVLLLKQYLDFKVTKTLYFKF